MPMPARTTLFLSNRSQAVRLPRAVAFAEGVYARSSITQDGPRRIIAPADAAWDDFFDAAGRGPRRPSTSPRPSSATAF